MKAAAYSRYPHLESLLKTSLFTDIGLPDYFSIGRAKDVLDIFIKHFAVPSGDNITDGIKNLLFESFARNVGCGENYGSGYPFDFLERLENKLVYEINEGLIYDIIEWKYNLSDYSLVILKQESEDEYYFSSNKNKRELICYSTFSKLAYQALEDEFAAQYEIVQQEILKISSSTWRDILDGEEDIQKYL